MPAEERLVEEVAATDPDRGSPWPFQICMGATWQISRQAC